MTNLEKIDRYDGLQARATAAEGERDRLREALGPVSRQPCLHERDGSGDCTQPRPWSGKVDPRTAWCFSCVARAVLAAIPHTEGEASAPPKLAPIETGEWCHFCGGWSESDDEGSCKSCGDDNIVDRRYQRLPVDGPIPGETAPAAPKENP